MYFFFYVRFNKNDPFRIISSSNHRWIHKSTEEINWKKRLS